MREEFGNDEIHDEEESSQSKKSSMMLLDEDGEESADEFLEVDSENEVGLGFSMYGEEEEEFGFQV